jgi:hypothetical protein
MGICLANIRPSVQTTVIYKYIYTYTHIFMLPTVIGMTCVPPCFFPLGQNLTNFLPWLDWNHDPPYPHPSCLATGWDGVWWIFCQWWPWTMILLISTSQVAGIIGKSQWHLVDIKNFTFNLEEWIFKDIYTYIYIYMNVGNKMTFFDMILENVHYWTF